MAKRIRMTAAEKRNDTPRSNSTKMAESIATEDRVLAGLVRIVARKGEPAVQEILAVTLGTDAATVLIRDFGTLRELDALKYVLADHWKATKELELLGIEIRTAQPHFARPVRLHDKFAAWADQAFNAAVSLNAATDVIEAAMAAPHADGTLTERVAALGIKWSRVKPIVSFQEVESLVKTRIAVALKAAL